MPLPSAELILAFWITCLTCSYKSPVLKTSLCAVPRRRSNLRVSSNTIRNLFLMSNLNLFQQWLMSFTSSLPHWNIKQSMLSLLPPITNSLIHKVVLSVFSLVTAWFLFVQSQINSALDTSCQGHQAFIHPWLSWNKPGPISLFVGVNLIFSSQRAVWRSTTALCW